MGESERKRVSSSPKLRRRSNKYSPSCLRSQFVRYTLRAARFILCMYVVSTLTAKAFMQVGIGQDPKITLKLRDFPEGHTLKLRHRRRQYATSCKGYAAIDDPYFVDYGGRYCGNVRFESKQQSQQPQSITDAVPIDELQTVDLTHKVFHTEEQAKEYFWRFWGIHSHSVLPAAFFMPVNDKMEMVADEHRALYYNPGVLVHSAVDDTTQSAHLIYFYRIERTVVVLVLSGYPKQPSPSINPELVARLSRSVNDRISFPSHLSSLVRQVSQRVLTFSRHLENGVARVVAATTHMVDVADEIRSRVLQRIVEELNNVRAHNNNNNNNNNNNDDNKNNDDNDNSVLTSYDNNNNNNNDANHDSSNDNDNDVVYTYNDNYSDDNYGEDDDDDNDDGNNLDTHDFYDEFDLIGLVDDELSDEYIAGHTHTHSHSNTNTNLQVERGAPSLTMGVGPVARMRVVGVSVGVGSGVGGDDVGDYYDRDECDDVENDDDECLSTSVDPNNSFFNHNALLINTIHHINNKIVSLAAAPRLEMNDTTASMSSSSSSALWSVSPLPLPSPSPSTSIPEMKSEKEQQCQHQDDDDDDDDQEDEEKQQQQHHHHHHHQQQQQQQQLEQDGDVENNAYSSYSEWKNATDDDDDDHDHDDVGGGVDGGVDVGVGNGGVMHNVVDTAARRRRVHMTLVDLSIYDSPPPRNQKPTPTITTTISTSSTTSTPTRGLYFGSHIDLTEELDYRGSSSNSNSNTNSRNTDTHTTYTTHSTSSSSSSSVLLSLSSASDYLTSLLSRVRMQLGLTTQLAQLPELLSMAKIILLVFVLIGASEIIDPPKPKSRTPTASMPTLHSGDGVLLR